MFALRKIHAVSVVFAMMLMLLYALPVTAGGGRHEIVFIENNVADYRTLVNGVRPGMEVHLLDASQDGLTQMTKILAGRSGISGIHLISHGSEAALQLGALNLNAQNLQAHAGDLATIGNALNPNADILLYGCNVAKGSDGTAFVQALAKDTHAVVAASTDLTGAVDKGGNWTLEYQTGTLDVATLRDVSYADTLALNATLDTSANPTLGSVLEGATNPAGVTVANMVVDGSITNSTDKSIAVEAVNSSLGSWQYSLDSGTNWLTMRADLLNSTTNTLGLLLPQTAQIRLLPYGTMNGTLSDAITFRAWNTSNGGTSGTYVVTTPGSDGYSTASDTASITVTSVNNAPTFAASTDGGVSTRLISSATYSSNDLNDIIIQPDGKILEVGSFQVFASDYDTSGNYTTGYALIRLNADGTLDTTFGTNGEVDVALGAKIALQADGKILLTDIKPNTGSTVGVIRLNANGTLDTSFGSSGETDVIVSSNGVQLRSIVVQTDGKILVGGDASNSAGYKFNIFRLTTNGTLDTTFNSTGKVTVAVAAGTGDDHCNSILIQPDGKIIMAGDASASTYPYNQDLAIIRLNADGTLDTTFNSTGKLITPFGATTQTSQDYGNSATLQSDGKILLAGYNGNDFGVIRVNANGTIDTTFGTSGQALVSLLSGQDAAKKVMVQSDGKIVLAGDSSNGTTSDFSLIRLTANGSLDTSYNGTGKVLMTVNGADTNTTAPNTAVSAVMQTDGKVVVIGYSMFAVADPNIGDIDKFTTFRMNTDGTLDTTFDSSGTNSLGGSVAYTALAAAVALDGIVTIYDAELTPLDSYSGASVSLARHLGADSTDLFGANGNLSLSGGNVVLSSVTIGTYTNANGTLAISFTGNATQARVNEALSSLTYANSSGTPPSSVQVDWTFNDGNSGSQGSGGAKTVTGSTTVNITVPSSGPTITTQAVTAITATTATGNGTITSLGAPNPTQYGVVWNTSGTPTTTDSKTAQGAASATGAFTSSMTGLTANTTYHVRAYATNSAGTSYGSEVSFITSAPAPTVTSITPNRGLTAGGTSVTIKGTGFVSGATVTIGGVTATASFVDAATLTATTPAGTVGAKDVVVTNPDTQKGTLTNGFTYFRPGFHQLWG